MANAPFESATARTLRDIQALLNTVVIYDLRVTRHAMPDVWAVLSQVPPTGSLSVSYELDDRGDANVRYGIMMSGEPSAMRTLTESLAPYDVTAQTS